MAQLRLSANYTQANHVTLRTGKCLSFLKSLPSDSARLVVTSPPYNIKKSYERRRQTLDEYKKSQRDVVAECLRILMPGGSLCWQVGQHINGHGQIIPLDMLLHEVFWSFHVSHELRLRNRMIWHFEHGLHCLRRFSGRYEVILWYTKGDDYYFNVDEMRVPQKYPGKKAYRGPKKGKPSGNPLGKNPGDVWAFPNVKGNHVEKTIHPCQFPIELAERLIVSLSKPNDLVVDPYAGVGSTLVAAVLNNRRSAGVDTVREYVDEARCRIRAAHLGDLRYRPRTRPVYQPKDRTPLTTPPPGFARWPEEVD